MVTLKGSPVELEGTFPKVGQKAPDFTLVDADLHEKSLYTDFSGKKVLVIVPSLDTPVCSISSKKFQEKLGRTPVSLLLISADLPFAQKRSCGADSKATTLSLMRDKKFAKDYGVLIKSGPLSGICTRAVLVLSEDNTVLYEELVAEITQEPNYDKALAAL